MPSTSIAPSVRVPHILCVDDEPAIREVLRALLRREGYDVAVAGTGAEALARLAQAPRDFDLLITDNEMPELSGLKLVQQLREAGNEVPIVVFSASLTTLDEDAFRGWQVDAIVAKGAPIDELLGEIRRLAGRPRLVPCHRGPDRPSGRSRKDSPVAGDDGAA